MGVRTVNRALRHNSFGGRARNESIRCEWPKNTIQTLMKPPLLTIALVVLIMASCNRKERLLQEGMMTMENTIKNNLNTLVDSCWNNKDLELLAPISTEDFTRTLNGIKVAGNQKELQAHINVYLTAFPDLNIHLKNTYIKDNQLFTHWTFTGTNTGVFGEFRATGKKAKVSGMSLLSFDSDGKLYREEVYYNELDLLQQLGYTLVPPALE
ncbi:MAG: hypothetical protein CMH48_13670 [Muricauda sp.]|nr:hypothetical protein [Allomuricauda sp.]MBC31877.1 hypothetical protein [Allomuricauda sp.]|tara:strand:+ start:2987 stop:3619 length:633 start_codon:yes stop_codon:yes gene_type:complete